MRVLLDECAPRKLRRELRDHDVKTLSEMGWAGIKNGPLLARAAAEFDAFITVDQNIQHQQRLPVPRLSIIILCRRGTSARRSVRKLPAKVRASGSLLLLPA